MAALTAQSSLLAFHSNPRMPLPLTPLYIELTPEGITRPVAEVESNAQVAVTVNAADFMAAFVRNMTND